MDENGHYETVGDVQEWRWDKGKAPTIKAPEGEFNPLDPVEEPKVKKVEPKKGEKK